MNASDTEIRIHRILGICAVLHSGLLLLPLLADGPTFPIWERSWVGLATLWFLWPIVLALHVAASARGATVPLIASSLAIAVWFRFYSTVLAPYVFGLPAGMDLTPPSMLTYAASYGFGWIDGKKRRSAGRLTFEGFGMSGTMTPDNPQFSDEAMKRFGLEIESVALCVVDTRIMAHAKGHNDAALGEIVKRFGRSAVTAAEEEEKRNQERYSAAMEKGRADAQRDVEAGHLALEVFRSLGEKSVAAEQMLKERFQIELRQVAKNWHLAGMDSKAHAVGYNEVSKAEVERRYGQEAAGLIREVFYTE